MKKIIPIIFILSMTIVTGFLACEKSDMAELERTAKRGGRGGSGTVTNPINCAFTISDTGNWYPAVNVSNIRSRQDIGYSYDPRTGTYSNPYGILVIDFDSVIIPGKTVNCYMLMADQCQGRVVCTKENGYFISQVTTCNTTNRFWIPVGTSWLNPNVPTYTGFIKIGTTDGCLYMSQPFQFQPARIINL